MHACVRACVRACVPLVMKHYGEEAVYPQETNTTHHKTGAYIEQSRVVKSPQLCPVERGY